MAEFGFSERNAWPHGTGSIPVLERSEFILKVFPLMCRSPRCILLQRCTCHCLRGVAELGGVVRRICFTALLQQMQGVSESCPFCHSKLASLHHAVWECSSNHLRFLCRAEVKLPTKKDADALWKAVKKGQKVLHSANTWLRAVVHGGMNHLDVITITDLFRVGEGSRKNARCLKAKKAFPGDDPHAVSFWDPISQEWQVNCGGRILHTGGQLGGCLFRHSWDADLAISEREVYPLPRLVQDHPSAPRARALTADEGALVMSFEQEKSVATLKMRIECEVAAAKGGKIAFQCFAGRHRSVVCALHAAAAWGSGGRICLFSRPDAHCGGMQALDGPVMVME